MKLWMVSFTEKGAALSLRLAAGLRARGYSVAGYDKEGRSGLLPYSSLHAWAGEAFAKAEGLVFIGACGIAVRAIAPHVRDKFTDPAVVVLDENAGFSIPVLSGHVGGANRLAREAAEITGAVLAVTTATDVNEKFAVDVWAKERGLALLGREEAKILSSVLLAGEKIGVKNRFPQQFPLPEPLPEGLEYREAGGIGFCISLDEEDRPFSRTLVLVPRLVVLGIGCRRGIESRLLEEAVLDALKAAHLSLHSVKKIGTIALKAEERAVLEFCGKYEIPLETFSARELMELPGEFSSSEFVRQTTGADNICERSAVLGSGNGELLFPKQRYPSVTVAAAICRETERLL